MNILGRKLQLPLPKQGRRKFLGMGIAAGVSPIFLSLLNACSPSANKTSKSEGTTNATGRAIKFSHGSGICNMPLFYSSEKGLFSKYGINGSVAMTPLVADIAAQLATGQVEMAVIPFTNAIAAYSQGASFQIVAGSGTEGLIVVAKPDIKNFKQLKGRKVGTFQADTLDIVMYDYLKKAGLTYADVEMIYFGDSTELLNAYLAGQVDAISHIEPYATKARASTNGNILGNGTDLYGKGYPDCVLAVRNELIKEEPEVVKDVIKTFFEAQYQIENDFEGAAKTTINKYYKTDLESLLAAAHAQPPGIDIRDKRDFIYSRAESMRELNYINTKLDENFVNFTLLQEVIDKNPQLLKRVKVKSVGA